MPFGSMLWDALTATGGALALTLIVAIALGIGALTLLFAGSAVVVLERFARASRLGGCAASSPLRRSGRWRWGTWPSSCPSWATRSSS